MEPNKSALRIKPAREVFNDAVGNAYRGNIEFAYWLFTQAESRARFEGYTPTAQEMQTLREAFKVGLKLPGKSLDDLAQLADSQPDIDMQLRLAETYAGVKAIVKAKDAALQAA